MAGSYEHVEDERKWCGMRFVENMGDAHETIHHMYFMIRYMSDTHEDRDGCSDEEFIKGASAAYYRCCRGESPWPYYMNWREYPI